MGKERLTLKWGTLKAWELDESGPAFAALKRYAEEPISMSAAAQKDSDTQKKAICEIIDALDNETVYLDWDGIDVSKEDAKKYVMEYRA